MTQGCQTRLACALMSTLLALPGCSDPKSSNGSAGATGGGGNPMGSGGAGSGGGAGMLAMAGLGGTAGTGEPPCNDLVITAPDVDMLYALEAPTPLGGVLVDGTYFGTSVTWYGRADGPDLGFGGIQVELQGTSWHEGESWPAGDNVNADRFANFEITASGTTIAFTHQCPASGEDKTVEYTAEGNALTLYVTEGIFLFGYAFARQ